MIELPFRMPRRDATKEQSGEPKLRRFFSLLVISLIVLLIGYAALYQCFSERVIYFDEVGLFNPVYMSLHYGKMTYPAHGQFNSMFVHPPTQYFLIAELMQLGLSVYHAAGLLSVLLFTAFAVVVFLSRFPFPIKVALLFGCFMGAFVWNEALVLRPDLSLTLAWATGLAALESARLNNWDSKRLAAGGFFLTLATAIHYPGVAAVLGLGIYAIWLWLVLPHKIAAEKIAWILAGASLVGIPYAVFFLIPHIRDVIGFSLAVQRDAPPGSAFERHLEAYAYWKHWAPETFRTRPVVTILTEPIFYWSIPAAFVGPTLLFLLPATRGIALASLPHLLFLLFGARHKQIGYSGYFAPEVVLYLIAITSLALTAFFSAVRLLHRPFVTMAAATVITISLAVAAVWDVPAIEGQRVIKTRGIYDLEASRAAGRAMLGANAVVGTTSAGVWYTCGATHLYFVTPEVLYPNDLSCFDLKKYFSYFDALAVDPHQTWVAYNKQHLSITSAYLNNTLQMRGFLFADRRSFFESGLSYMLYSVRRPEHIVGYGIKGQNVARFREESGGNQVFVSAVCPVNATEGYGELDNSSLKLDFYAVFFRPIPSNKDPRGEEDHNVQAAIVTFIADRSRFERDLSSRLKRCTVRDQIEGSIIQRDLQAFMHEYEKTDQPVAFYPTFDDFRQSVGHVQGHEALLEAGASPSLCGPASAEAIRKAAAPHESEIEVKPPPDFTFSFHSGARLDKIALAYDKATIERGPPVVVSTAPEQWAYAASIPLQLDHTGKAMRFIHVRCRVLAGQIGIGVLNAQANDFQVEKFVDPSPGTRDIYLPVSEPSHADALIFRNTAFGATASKILLEDTEALASGTRLQSSVGLNQIRLASSKAAIEHGSSIEVTTAPEQWAYAAEVPLDSSASKPGAVLRLRGRVLEGEIGFGILTADKKSFSIEQSYPSSVGRGVDVVLPIAPSSAALIVRNTATGGRKSKVLLDSLELWKLN